MYVSVHLSLFNKIKCTDLGLQYRHNKSIKMIINACSMTCFELSMRNFCATIIRVNMWK